MGEFPMEYFVLNTINCESLYIEHYTASSFRFKTLFESLRTNKTVKKLELVIVRDNLNQFNSLTDVYIQIEERWLPKKGRI